MGFEINKMRKKKKKGEVEGRKRELASVKANRGREVRSH
jgi:hypothetical protein